MGRYIVRRILISIPTVLGITVVVFLLSNMIPGDPIDYMIPPEGGIAPRPSRGCGRPMDSISLCQSGTLRGSNKR